MMRRILPLLLAGFALAGCVHVAHVPPPGYLPEDAFGNSVVGEDPAFAAVTDAMMAFAYPQRLQGNPAGMALAIASLDAMAGQFAASGRWAGWDEMTKQEMMDARTQVRAILGVPANASSQAVIDHLVAASHALDRGDQAAALAALSGPEFTASPARTLAILSHFPRVPAANKATMDANLNFFPSGRD